MVKTKSTTNFISAFFILCFCFSGQYIVLPAYRELSNPTSERGIKASSIYVLFYAFITTSAGLFGLLTIG